jgi:hypothetical protein
MSLLLLRSAECSKSMGWVCATDSPKSIQSRLLCQTGDRWFSLRFLDTPLFAHYNVPIPLGIPRLCLT